MPNRQPKRGVLRKNNYFFSSSDCVSYYQQNALGVHLRLKTSAMNSHCGALVASVKSEKHYSPMERGLSVVSTWLYAMEITSGMSRSVPFYVERIVNDKRHDVAACI